MAIGAQAPDNPFSTEDYNTPASVPQRVFSTLGSSLTGEANALNSAMNQEQVQADKNLGITRPDDRMLPTDEIKKQYGFNADGPMTANSASGMAEQLDIEQQTEAKYRGAGFVGRNGPQLIAGLADPVNAPLYFMPELGLTGKLATKLGGEAPGVIARTAARTAVGGTEATVMNIPAIGIQAETSQSEGHEFSANDLMRNLGVSFMMGTVIHPIMGGVSDTLKPAVKALRDTPVDDRVNALKSSIGGILNDEPIDPAPVFEQASIGRGEAPDSYMASKEIEFKDNKQVTESKEAPQKPVSTDYSALKPEDLKGAVKEVFDEEVAKRQSVAQAPEASIVESKLPRELAGAKPRYKNETPQFESDIDKALYIVGNETKKSASDAKYRDFLKQNGYDDAAIAQGSKQIRDRVKETANTAEPGKLKIEKQNDRAVAKDAEPPKPAATISDGGVNKVELRKAMNEAGVKFSDGPDVAAQKLLARQEQIKAASQVDARSHMDAYINHLKTMRAEGTIMGTPQEEVRNLKETSDAAVKEIKANPSPDVEKLNKLNTDLEQMYEKHSDQPEYQEIAKIKEDGDTYKKAIQAAAQCLGKL